MHIAFITAGGAGMFCGSCMHDNTWTRALRAAGAEVSLLPTYTPIRVDELDASQRQVFLGGVNVYLNSLSTVWRKMPRGMKRVFDSRWFIKLATKLSISNEAAKLGDLAIDMLAGPEGPHRASFEELARHLATIRPDVIIFSNGLLSGALPAIREVCSAPVACVFQGDDLFLDTLPDSHRSQAVDAMSRNTAAFDRFLVHSRFYRDYIAAYLGFDTDRFEMIPLGIDFTPHTGRPRSLEHRAPVVGFFARIAPEKGLHHLVVAIRLLKERLPDVRLKVGGFLGKPQRRYFREILREAKSLGSDFEYIGSPDTVEEKSAFLQSIDVLSVPTEFLEPKGLYVLEAWANGVPVVQPQHGSFPEMIEKTGGGLLVEPKNPAALADGLESLLVDDVRRMQLANAGYERVRSEFSLEAMSSATLGIFRALLNAKQESSATNPTFRL